MRILLDRVRRAISDSDAPIEFRIVLERDPDADRDTCARLVEELVDDLEASIRGAGSFDTLQLSHTADHYSRAEWHMKRDERQIADLRALLSVRDESGPPLLESLAGSVCTNELESELDERQRSWEKLRSKRPRTGNVFIYVVDFEPVSGATSEVIVSEFDRLASLDTVANVEVEYSVPSTDPRHRLDWNA